jgi:lipopolysaccharide export system protein LptC
MNRITISIGILFLLIMGIYLPSWMSGEQDAPVQTSDESWQPNYQARNLRSTLYDNDGNISHQVFAARMEHYQLLGFTIFAQPQYTIFLDSQEKPWQVVAKEGTLYEDNRILLETDVEIRSLDQNGFVQTIKTQFLEVNLIDKTMMSDQPVEISGKDFVVNSNGFEGNMLTQKYELLDHVQTMYSPR